MKAISINLKDAIEEFESKAKIELEKLGKFEKLVFDLRRHQKYAGNTKGTSLELMYKSRAEELGKQVDYWLIDMGYEETQF